MGYKMKGYFLLVLIFTILFRVSVFANESNVDIKEKSKVLLNGIDTNIEAEQESSFVPLKTFAEMLGCNFSYDPLQKTVSVTSDDLNISLEIGNKKAVVNGGEILMDEAAIIDSGICKAPLNFIIKAIGGYIPKMQGEQGSIRIFTSYPVWFNNKMGAVKAKRYYFYEELEGWEDYLKYAEYEVIIPSFVNMQGEGANDVNKAFKNDYTAIKGFFVKDIREQKLNNDSAPYTMTEFRSFRVINQYNDIISMVYEGYSYYGGAHGMPMLDGVNLNLSDPYILPLKDLFIGGSDYKKILLEKINSVIKNNQDLYYVKEVSELPPANSFYIEGDKLVIYYYPYDIAPYGAGFVAFEFPLSELSEILKDEFKQD